MVWYQAAYDEEALPNKAWVVLLMTFNGKYVTPVECGRYPTRHEAEGHARKNWEKTGR